MNKAHIVLAASLFLLLSSNSFAGDFSNSAMGGVVNISTTGITGVTPQPVFNFTPSSGIWMNGGTTRNSFVVGSVHNAVLGKDNGRNYGMASDSSNIFWTPTVGLSAISPLTGKTNSTAINGWNRE